jgi:Domain of unknown function (DUF4136)
MRIATFATAVGVALAGTIAIAQTVTYDFDRGTNFGKYKTYAWTRGTELADQLNHARVVRSIESQLATKGLSKVDTNGAPDLLIAYHTSFEKNLQINAWSSGYGAPRFGGLRSGTATTQEIVTGTLVVDLLDAGSKNIVWRGLASGELDPAAKPEKREKNLNKATQKLFKNYPPKP